MDFKMLKKLGKSPREQLKLEKKRFLARQKRKPLICEKKRRKND
jgi:hypothetical protein